MADRKRPEPHERNPLIVHSGHPETTDPDANTRNSAHTAHTPEQRYTGLRVTVQGHGAPLTVVLRDESSAHTLLGYLRRLADRGRARIER